MRVLLDTNIILDYLGANKGFTEDSEKIFTLLKIISNDRIAKYNMCKALEDWAAEI
jgi:predicted nucleic acid-binding protein